MDLIKAHYEKFLVILGGAILLGAAGWVVALESGWLGAPPEDVVAPARQDFKPDPEVARTKAEMEAADNAKRWDANARLPFVSRLYFERGGRLVDPSDDKESFFDGIANSWIIANGWQLDTFDPEGDEDADGYSNREESAAGTDPRNPSSHPDINSKLVRVEVKPQELGLTFAGPSQTQLDPATGKRTIITQVQINTTTEGSTTGLTAFYQVGDKIRRYALRADGTEVVETDPVTKQPVLDKEGKPKYGEPTGFEITRAYFDKPNAPATEDPDPRVEIRSTTGGETLNLRKNEKASSPYPEVTLRDTRHQDLLVLRVGDTFELKDAAGNKRYLLMPMDGETVRVKDLASGKVWPVAAAPNPGQAKGEPSPSPAP